jgi:large subunit ribosomal protein L29
MTTVTELRAKGSKELAIENDELRREFFQLRMQHHTGQLDDTSRLRVVRRDIARIETILGEHKAAADAEKDNQ